MRAIPAVVAHFPTVSPYTGCRVTLHQNLKRSPYNKLFKTKPYMFAFCS